MCNFEITISKGNLLNKVEEYKVLTKSEVQKTIASGDDGVEETLLPIPNRTVKLYSVNGTAWVTVWRVERCQVKYALLAQLVEHLTLNQGVPGSNP